MLKLGIIGCGRIVEFAHADALKSLADEVQVVAIADTSARQLDLIGTMLQIEPCCRYGDYRKMVDEETM